MNPARVEVVHSPKLNRRPRSRGVAAPARKPRHGLVARLRLIWLTMYPLPRIMIGAALLTALAYGIVAVFWLLPTSDGELIYFVVLPVAAVVCVMLLGRGEPNDQTSVHHPAHVRQTMTDAEFDALEDRVDRLSKEPAQGAAADTGKASTATGPYTASYADPFMALVRKAIDGLPPEFANALDHVAVVVSDQGSVQRRNGRLQPLYGLYVGYAGRGSLLGSPRIGGSAPDRIVIFRDTLTHDFGGDPQRLQEEVTRTLRHELGHHLGYDEPGVRSLGL